VKHYVIFLIRTVVLIVILATWQRVLLGIPLHCVLQNPEVLWTDANAALQNARSACRGIGG